jgi:hypothetical protein
VKSERSSDAAALDGLIALLATQGIAADVATLGGGRADDSPAHDAVLTLDVDGARHQVVVKVARRWSTALDGRLEQFAARDARMPMLLLLPRIDAARRAWLRERGINAADLTGAVSLQLPGVRLELDGAPTRQWGVSIPSTRQVNPFAKKASLVLRRFFEQPRVTHSVSALAKDLGIAIGWAWEVSEELRERGYIAGKGEHLQLADASSALVDWCAVYTWKKSRRRNFVVPYTQAELTHQLLQRWEPRDMPWALTLLTGAQRRIGHVTHDAATYVYAVPPSPAALVTALASVHALEVVAPVPETHTLAVLTPWYGAAALRGMQWTDAVPVVSDVQLFLDLAHFPLRGAEAATHLLRTRLAPALGLTTRDVARVEARLG